MSTTTNNSIQTMIEAHQRKLDALTEALAYDKDCEKQGIKPSKEMVRKFRDEIADAIRQTGTVRDLSAALEGDHPLATLRKLQRIVDAETTVLDELIARKTNYISGSLIWPESLVKVKNIVTRRYRVLITEFDNL